MLDDEPMTPKGTVIARNILHHGVRPFRITEEAEPYVTMEDNLADVDPHFADAAKGDFRLRADSPAWNIGFEPIPLEKIGLYEHEHRASWPVEHKPEQRTRQQPIHDFMQVDGDADETND